ncbi:MAG: hypothetical protein HN867_14190 [Deltaproteobacteria bacterium]|nr:hypothetical protein [Deltaproteobacteria bacterium]MBT7204613.1 hypothetical protein [Deltaproteobacteria bacterium]
MLQNFLAKRRELRRYFEQYPELQAKVIELAPVPFELLLQQLAPTRS